MRVRRPNLAARRLPSSAATFSQSLRDRQYTIPHCGRPCAQNWRQMRSSISVTASSNLVFFFTTSYLRAAIAMLRQEPLMLCGSL